MAKRKVSRRRGPLAAWIKGSGLTLTQTAKLIGCSVQHVSNLIHGHNRPSLETAVAIEQATRGAVSVASWNK
mgnify:CR=1 FL=1